MYWLLNSAVIPVGGDGTYEFRTVTQVEAIAWLRNNEFTSRIGYPENAEFIRRIAGVAITLSREESPMRAGDQALVVRPAYRLAAPDKRKRFVPTDDEFVFGILDRLT